MCPVSQRSVIAALVPAAGVHRVHLRFGFNGRQSVPKALCSTRSPTRHSLSPQRSKMPPTSSPPSVSYPARHAVSHGCASACTSRRHDFASATTNYRRAALDPGSEGGRRSAICDLVRGPHLRLAAPTRQSAHGSAGPDRRHESTRLDSRRQCRTGKSVQVRHGPRHCDQGSRTPVATEPHGLARLGESVRSGSQETACIVV